jgi:hypothetical protein
MNVQVGDVVLSRDEAAAGQSHKYVQVLKVHTDTDGMICSANLEYKLPGENKFRVTTRPIRILMEDDSVRLATNPLLDISSLWKEADNKQGSKPKGESIQL